MNLAQKLVEIQKAVRALGKDANGNSYQYVSGSKVLAAVRERMDKLGVLLVQQVESIDNERIDYPVKSGMKSELLTKVMMTFIWIDAESNERLEVKFGANGMNSWDKGLGSALTYAERYFLLKFFHIATDEDDVDALPPRGNEEGVKMKSRMSKGSKAWNSAVEKQASGEDMTQAINERFLMTMPDWEQFNADVADYAIRNNLV